LSYSGRSPSIDFRKMPFIDRVRPNKTLWLFTADRSTPKVSADYVKPSQNRCAEYVAQNYPEDVALLGCTGCTTAMLGFVNTLTRAERAQSNTADGVVARSLLHTLIKSELSSISGKESFHMTNTATTNDNQKSSQLPDRETLKSEAADVAKEVGLLFIAYILFRCRVHTSLREQIRIGSRSGGKRAKHRCWDQIPKQTIPRRQRKEPCRAVNARRRQGRTNSPQANGFR